MLAIINPWGWDAAQTGSCNVDASVRTRSFNFMASLHSLATCAAGATPTAVNPVNSSTNVKNTSFNCIKLISNTEAGGWLVGASNGVTASTTFSAGASSLYVDLYRDSGKSQNPWYRYSIGHDAYTFSSGSFDSYPQLQTWGGHASSSSYNPSTTAISTDSNYYNGSTSYFNYTTGYTQNPSQRLFHATLTDQIYVAVTANYIILSQYNQMWYYGIRNQAGWELGRTDNPAWATFGMCGDNGSAAHIQNNSQHTEFAQAWMAGIYSNGTQSSGGKRGDTRVYSQGMNAITGQNTSASNNQFNMSYALRPLFPMGYPSNMSMGYGWAPEAPVTDPVTGLTVPPAYPIVFNWSNGSETCSGQVPGIYKGMSQDGTGLNFYVTASEYVIDGQSYIPVRTANSSYPELFFIRKA